MLAVSMVTHEVELQPSELGRFQRYLNIVIDIGRVYITLLCMDRINDFRIELAILGDCFTYSTNKGLSCKHFEPLLSFWWHAS